MIRFWEFVKGILIRKEAAPIAYDADNEGAIYNDNDTGIRVQIEGADREVVTDTQVQTLTNKTLTAPIVTSPVLTTPQINDTSSDHQYIVAVNELAADRTVTLPLLTGNDEFTFNAHAATLTNKSIDADTNTITNIENADIKAAAAIDATKIHDGTVTNTEFGYLAAVTSDIQVQIDTKASSASLTAHIDDAADAHDASAISSVASGNLAATDVQAALNELQSDIDTRALASGLTDHLNDAADAHDASAISSVASGNLVATTVQAALDELQTDIDTRLTASSTNTLTNKSIDADTNTITNIDNADIKSGAAIDATKIHDGTVTNTEFGYLANVSSDIQTQIDTKASTTALNDHISDATDAHAGTAITNTPSGNLAATTVQAALNELQTDVDTRATSAALSSHEADTTSIHGIADTSLLVTTTGSQTLTNKTLQADLIDNYIDFNHETTPANPAAGTIRIYPKNDDKLYKLTSAGVESEIGSGGGTSSLTVQTKTTTYTVLSTDDVVLASTSGGAWTLTLYTPVSNSGKVIRVKKTTADFSVLTVSPAAGSIAENGTTVASTTLNTKDEEVCFLSDGTNWHVLDRKTATQATAYTPTGTWSTNTVYSGFWWRVADSIRLEISVHTTGAPTSAALSVNIPSGLTIDTAKISSLASTEPNLGFCHVHDAGVKDFPLGKVTYTSTTAIRCKVSDTATTEVNITQVNPMTFANGDDVMITTVLIPISGWKA